MRRRTAPRILAVGVLLLALTGCVRFQADLTLTPDDTVDGNIVVAVLAQDETDESQDAARTAAQQIETTLLGELRAADGVTTSDYAEDDYVGSRIDFDGVALDAFSGQNADALTFTREGDAYIFTGALDFGDESVPADGADDAADDDGNLTVSVTFPGAVGEHNGELSGTTVTWSTTLEERLEMSARGAAAPAGPPLVLIVVLVLAVLVVVAAIVGLVLLLRSRAAKGPAAVEGGPEALPKPEA